MIFTIGHSNKPFEDLLERLRRHGVQTLIDVRSSPHSSYTPWFDHSYLKAQLPEAGIEYEFFGDTLGGRPGNPAYYKHNGEADYERMARDEGFLDSLGIITSKSDRTVLCLLCSEEDPARCHRGKLIARQLALSGVEVAHILGDGSLETEEDNSKKRMTIKENQLELF